MKITERRLRQLIRSVIKENMINEMFDMHNPFDSIAGASGHADASRELVRQFNNFNQVITVSELLQSSAVMGGLIQFMEAESFLSMFAGLGISVGTLLWVGIREYCRNSGCSGEEKRKLMNVQKKIEDQCPQCINEVEEMNL